MTNGQTIATRLRGQRASSTYPPPFLPWLLFLAVLASLSAPAMAQPSCDPLVSLCEELVINEADVDDWSSDLWEFVELYNPGLVPVPLADKTVELLDWAGVPYATFNLTDVYNTNGDVITDLMPGQYLVLGTDRLFPQLAPDTPRLQFDYYTLQNGYFGIRIRGDAIDPAGSPYTVDAISFGAQIPGASEGYEAAAEDDALSSTDWRSASRCGNGVDRDQNGLDFTLRPWTAGRANACGRLVVNEVDLDQGDPDGWSFIELLNAGSEPWPAAGLQLQLFDSTGLTLATLDLSTLTAQVEPGQYLTVGDPLALTQASGQSTTSLTLATVLPAGIAGARLQVEYLGATYPLDAATFGASIADVVEGSPAGPDSLSLAGDPRFSMSRCIDGADSDDNARDYQQAQSTPGGYNACGRLVINEVDYNQAGGDAWEFVEVFNAGSVPVDLAGIRLETATTAGPQYAWPLTDSGAQALAPGEYLLVGTDTYMATLPASLPTIGVPIYTFQDTVIGVAVIADVNGIDRTLDSMSYDGPYSGTVPGYTEGTTPAPDDDAVGTGNDGQSISRCLNGLDQNDTGADFRVSPATPGAANTCAVAPSELTSMATRKVAVDATVGATVNLVTRAEFDGATKTPSAAGLSVAQALTQAASHADVIGVTATAGTVGAVLSGDVWIVLDEPSSSFTAARFTVYNVRMDGLTVAAARTDVSLLYLDQLGPSCGKAALPTEACAGYPELPLLSTACDFSAGEICTQTCWPDPLCGQSPLARPDWTRLTDAEPVSSLPYNVVLRADFEAAKAAATAPTATSRGEAIQLAARANDPNIAGLSAYWSYGPTALAGDIWLVVDDYYIDGVKLFADRAQIVTAAMTVNVDYQFLNADFMLWDAASAELQFSVCGFFQLAAGILCAEWMDPSPMVLGDRLFCDPLTGCGASPVERDKFCSADTRPSFDWGFIEWQGTSFVPQLGCISVSASNWVDCAESICQSAYAICQSTAEVCEDGVDNNCDGSVDESGCCTPGAIVTTACPQEADVDCDGVIDSGCCDTAGTIVTLSCPQEADLDCDGAVDPACCDTAGTIVSLACPQEADANCDGVVDPDCCTPGAIVTLTCPQEADVDCDGVIDPACCDTAGTIVTLSCPQEADLDCNGAVDPQCSALPTFERKPGSLGFVLPTWRISKGAIDVSADGNRVISGGGNFTDHRLWVRDANGGGYTEATEPLMPTEFGHERVSANALFVDLDGDTEQDLLFLGAQNTSPPHAYFWRPDLGRYDAESVDGPVFPNERYATIKSGELTPAERALLSVNDVAIGDWDDDGEVDIFLARGGTGRTGSENQIIPGPYTKTVPIPLETVSVEFTNSVAALFVPELFAGRSVFLSVDASASVGGLGNLAVYYHDGLTVQKQYWPLGETQAQTLGVIDLDGNGLLDIIVFDGYPIDNQNDPDNMATRFNVRDEAIKYLRSTMRAACQYCADHPTLWVCEFHAVTRSGGSTCSWGDPKELATPFQHKIFLNQSVDGVLTLVPLDPLDANGDFVDLWPEVLRDPYVRIDEARPIAVKHGLACTVDADCDNTACRGGVCDPTTVLFMHSAQTAMSDGYVSSVHLAVLEPKPDGGVGLAKCAGMDPGLDVSDLLYRARPADLNQDGATDLLLAFWTQQAVFRGDDTGCFVPESSMPVGEIRRNSTTLLADFNGDGYLDIFSVSGEQPLPEDHHPFRSLDVLMLNDGDGHFTDRTRLLPDADVFGSKRSSRVSRGAVAADFDHDEDLDIIVTQYYNNSSCAADSAQGAFRVFENQLDLQQGFVSVDAFPPEFVDIELECTGGLRVANIAAGNFDGNEWPDLVAVSRKGVNRVFRNQGVKPVQFAEFELAPGAVVPSVPSTGGGNRSQAVVAFEMDVMDIDGDGLDDIVIGADQPGTLFGAGVFITTITGGKLSWEPVQLERGPEYRYLAGMVVGDVTGDGLPDVIVVSTVSDDQHPNLAGDFVYDKVCGRQGGTPTELTCFGKDVPDCDGNAKSCPLGTTCDTSSVPTGECVVTMARAEVICCADQAYEGNCKSTPCKEEDSLQACRDTCAATLGTPETFFLDAFLNDAPFEGDASPDDSIGRPAVHEVFVYVNNGPDAAGNPWFTPISLNRQAVYPGNNPSSVKLADMNADGRLDLILGVYSPGMRPSAYNSRTVRLGGDVAGRRRFPYRSADQILLNPGWSVDDFSGPWIEAIVPDDTGKTYGIAVGNIDDDPRPELIKAGESRFSIWSWR